MRGLLADRRLHWAAIGVAVLIAFLLIGLAMFPWGALKPRIEKTLSHRLGSNVTIAKVERLDTFSFTPTIAIRGVRVPQPQWAGKGDLAEVATAQVRFNAFSMLTGHFHPRSIDLSGLKLALVRDATRHENWSGLGSGGGSGRLALDRLSIADGTITYRDAVQNRQFTVALAADAKDGVRLAGKGSIQGNPVTLAAHGPPVTAATRDKPWPFRGEITGSAVGMTIVGTMDHPLDAGHMTLDMTTHASDLKLVDAIIEAGLFGTQPVKLKAHARHDAPDWTITSLSGTIGQSDIAGHILVKKRDGRTKLNGAVTSNQLAFEDLASNAGAAAAIAKERTGGLKLVPDTRINLAHVGKTDGTIDFNAKQIVSRRRPSSLTYTHGTLTLDHRLLTIAPFTLGLKQGAITGRITVDQRDGSPLPLVKAALDLKGSTIASIAGGDGDVNGRLSGHVRLTGHGSTFREVIGHGDGSIGIVAQDGRLPAKIASLLGFDVARGLTTDSDKEAGLRCAVVRLDMKGGTGTLDPMVIDTTRAQSHGQGTISFPSETLAIRITGAPKAKSVLRLPGAILAGGTIRAPEVTTEKGTKSIGNIFKAIGQSISGHQAPRATDADCSALGARALN